MSRSERRWGTAGRPIHILLVWTKIRVLVDWFEGNQKAIEDSKVG